MEKTALVLSGGGSRGAYEIGVWRALMELGERLSIVTGSSVGALNGAMVAQGDFETAENLWRELETKNLFSLQVKDDCPPARRRREIIKSFSAAVLMQGGADPAPLEQLLKRYVHEDRVRASGVRLGFATLRVEDGKPRYLWADALPQGELHNYLLASSALFPAIRPRKIQGKHYVDGGYADNLPIRMALSAGATRVIAVRLDAPGIIRKPQRREGVSLREIHSWWDLGSILFFDPACARQNIRLGYLDAMRSYGVYDGCAYAFIKGSLDKQLRGCFLPRSEAIFSLYCGRERREPAVLRKRLRRRGLSGFLRSLCLDAMECAGELWGLDPAILYSAERFNERLRQAVRESQHPAGDPLLSGRRAAALGYARRLGRWFSLPKQKMTPPSPPGLAAELCGGLSRGESGFAAAVYLALADIMRDDENEV